MNEYDETQDLPAAPGLDDRDSRLEEIILQYLKAADAGRPLDRRHLIEQHPDLADELRAFFAEEGSVEAILPRSREPATTLPARVGRCEIRGELGQGGMGAVLKGH